MIIIIARKIQIQKHVSLNVYIVKNTIFSLNVVKVCTENKNLNFCSETRTEGYQPSYYNDGKSIKNVFKMKDVNLTQMPEKSFPS